MDKSSYLDFMHALHVRDPEKISGKVIDKTANTGETLIVKFEDGTFTSYCNKGTIEISQPYDHKISPELALELGIIKIDQYRSFMNRTKRNWIVNTVYSPPGILSGGEILVDTRTRYGNNIYSEGIILTDEWEFQEFISVLETHGQILGWKSRSASNV